MAGLFFCLAGGGKAKRWSLCKVGAVLQRGVALQSGGVLCKEVAAMQTGGALSKPVAALPSPTFPKNTNLTNEKNANRIIYYQIVLKFDSSI